MILVTKLALVHKKVKMFLPLHYSKLDLSIRYHRMQICPTCCNGGLVGSLSESSLVIIEIGLPVSCKNNSFPEIFTFKNDLFEGLTCCTAAETSNDAVLHSALSALLKRAISPFSLRLKHVFNLKQLSSE